MTADDERQRRRDEFKAMTRNSRRFGIEHNNTTNLSRVVDQSQLPPTPLSDWLEHDAALALRDDYFRGHRQPPS